MGYKINLDHFYGGFSPSQFEELKQLTDVWDNTDYLHTVVNENFEYKGVYIRTYDGQYVELLDDTVFNHERINGYMFNIFDSPNIDWQKLNKSLPDGENFQCNEIPNKVPESATTHPTFSGKQGEDWFYGCKPSFQSNSQKHQLTLMNYCQPEFNWVYEQSMRNLVEDFSIKQINKVQIAVSNDEFSTLSKLFSWVGEVSQLASDLLEVRCHNPNGDPIIFIFDNYDNRQQGFRSISFDLQSNKKYSVPDQLNIIDLLQNGRSLEMVFSDY